MQTSPVLTPPYRPNVSGYIQNGIAYGEVYSVSFLMHDSKDYYNTARVELIFNKESGLIRVADSIPGYSHVWHVTRSLVK